MANTSKMKRAENTPESPLHVFFVATTKSEKINQLTEVAIKLKKKCIFLPITALGEPAHSPDEEEGTFKANLGEKIYEAAHQLNGYSKDKALAALASMGIKPGDLENGSVKTYAMAEDSGFAFQSNEIAEEFLNYYLDSNNKEVDPVDRDIIAGIKKYSKLPAHPFPDAETVDVVAGCGGTDQFMRLLKQFGDAKGYNTNPAFKQGNNWINIVNSSTLATFEWTPGEKVNLAQLKGKIKEKYGEHIQVFLGTGHSLPEGERTTYDYVGAHNDAKSQKKFTPDGSRGIHYQPKARANAFEGLCSNKMLKIPSLNELQYIQYSMSRGADTSADIHDFKVGLLSPATGFTSVSHQEAIIKKLKDHHMLSQIPSSGVSSYSLHNDVLSLGDAYVFFAPKDAGNASAMREHQSMLMSLLVHKQLDPEGKDKPIILQYDQRNGEVEKQDKQLLSRYFNLGVYGDRPSQTTITTHSDNETIEKLRLSRSTYHRVKTETKAAPRAPKIETYTFHVAVFCSATLGAVFEEKGFDFAGRLAEEDFGLAWGAGDRKMMGALYNGYMAACKKSGKKGSMIGSTTDVIGKTETRKGAMPEGLVDGGYAADTITDRMDYLFKNSEAYVFMEGGIGTLQEFHRYEWYKEHEPDVVKGKPLIIAQSAYLQKDGEKEGLLKHAIDRMLGKPYSEWTQAEKEEHGVFVIAPNLEAIEGKKLFEKECKKIIEILKPYRDKDYEDKGIKPPFLPGMQPEGGAGYIRH
jgi:predicted Rossmann-fold nucleotide-binding protein